MPHFPLSAAFAVPHHPPHAATDPDRPLQSTLVPFLSLSAYRRPAEKNIHPTQTRCCAAIRNFCTDLQIGIGTTTLSLHFVAMSNLKRKAAPGGQPPAKSAKNTKEGRPSKTDGSATAKSKPAKPTKAKESDDRPKAPAVSLLKNEEPIFPRGGGSVLTPLEQKQIQLEAKADARREEEFDTSGGKAQKKQKKKKISTKGDKKGSDKKDSEDSVKVESLNFKVIANSQSVNCFSF